MHIFNACLLFECSDLLPCNHESGFRKRRKSTTIVWQSGSNTGHPIAQRVAQWVKSKRPMNPLQCDHVFRFHAHASEDFRRKQRVKGSTCASGGEADVCQGGGMRALASASGTDSSTTQE